MGQKMVDPIRAGCFGIPVDQRFLNDFLNKVVFLVDDLLTTGVRQPFGKGNGVFLHNDRVAFQNFHGVPTVVGHIGILLFQLFLDNVDFILDLIAVHHGKFVVMVVEMT